MALARVREFGITPLSCCGWKEITGIRMFAGNVDDVFRDLITLGGIYRGGVPCGAFIFTEALGAKVALKRFRYAAKFADAIEKLELGEIKKLAQFKNPNTGHYITTYMWVVDANAVVEYCLKQNLFER